MGISPPDGYAWHASGRGPPGAYHYGEAALPEILIFRKDAGSGAGRPQEGHDPAAHLAELLMVLGAKAAIRHAKGTIR